MQSYLFLEMNPKKFKNISPRIKVIQKLYNSFLNPETKLVYPKNQFRKFIKDVVTGTLERSELIEDTINSHLSNDINLTRTDKLLKIILFLLFLSLCLNITLRKK